jgi:hypothetical protein
MASVENTGMFIAGSLLLLASIGITINQVVRNKKLKKSTGIVKSIALNQQIDAGILAR